MGWLRAAQSASRCERPLAPRLSGFPWPPASLAAPQPRPDCPGRLPALITPTCRVCLSVSFRGPVRRLPRVPSLCWMAWLGWGPHRSALQGPPCAPGAGRARPGRREPGVARFPLRPPLCLTVSFLPFLKLKESLDTGQFDLCPGQCLEEGGGPGEGQLWAGVGDGIRFRAQRRRWRGDTRASVSGPRPAGLRVGRIGEVCPRVLGGLVAPAAVPSTGITSWTCCLSCASPGSRALGSLPAHLGAEGVCLL